MLAQWHAGDLFSAINGFSRDSGGGRVASKHLMRKRALCQVQHFFGVVRLPVVLESSLHAKSGRDTFVPLIRKGSFFLLDRMKNFSDHGT